MENMDIKQNNDDDLFQDQQRKSSWIFCLLFESSVLTVLQLTKPFMLANLQTEEETEEATSQKEKRDAIEK